MSIDRRGFVATMAGFLSLGVAGPASAEPGAAEAGLIERLLQEVANARGVVFIRNGAEGTPAAAAKHLRDKYDHFRQDIATADDFIRLCGTRSELSKQPYQVRLPDGKTRPAADWLRERLGVLRASAR